MASEYRQIFPSEPVFGTEGSRAQTLFNLLIGQAYEESKKQDETVDRTWGHDLLCAATEPEQASEGNES